MKIVVQDKTYFVDWKYENPELVTLLHSKGISERQFREMKFTKVIELLNVQQLPSPKFTVCFIRDENKEPIVEERAIRSHKDQFCKEKGRRYSMRKSYIALFPGLENKMLRRTLWENYLGTKTKNKKDARKVNAYRQAEVVGDTQEK